MIYAALVAMILLSIYFVFLLPKHRKELADKNSELSAASERATFSKDQSDKTQEAFANAQQELKETGEKLTQLREKFAAIEVMNVNITSEQATLKEQNGSFSDEIEKLKDLIQQTKERNSSLEATNTTLANAKIESVNSAKEKLNELEEKLDTLREEKNATETDLVALREQEPIRIEEHKKAMERLNVTIQNIQNDRAREITEKESAANEKLIAMKETWSRHEAEVEQKMRLICQELSINYIDKEKFPFTGKPDNSVKICDEYIIFDGKSPQGEDLSNFPTYIRTQAEQTKKYAKNEEVKKDVFLVVPTSAIQSIDDTHLQFATHRVHVITLDALKPILIQLKKLEDYEFAEKLSPEDREKIVTTLGKMAHGMKRRVQIDHYFSNEFISILTDAENLPAEILEGARVVERSSKLNPTIHNRNKRIELTALKKDSDKLSGKVAGQEIHTGPELTAIAALPLHKDSDDDAT